MEISDLENVDAKDEEDKTTIEDEQQQQELQQQQQLENDNDKEESTEEDVNYFKTRYEIFLDYADYTTIQGLNSIFFEYQSQFGKAVWSVVVVLMLVLGTYWSFMLYSSWWSSPTVSTITTISMPIQQVDFPTVTFCGSGANEVVLTSAIINEFYNYSRISNSTPIELAMTLLWDEGKLKDPYLQDRRWSQVNGLYSTILQDKLPDFKGKDLEKLKKLATLLTSSNPDKVLQSDFPSVFPKKAKGPCPSYYVGDTFCYRIVQPVANVDFQKSQDGCISRGDTLLQFEKDADVQNFLELNSSGVFNISSQNTFFVNAHRSLQDSSFLFKNGQNLKIMASVLIESDTDTSLDCLKTKLASNSTMMTLIPVDCSAQLANSIICMMDNSRIWSLNLDTFEPLINPAKITDRSSQLIEDRKSYKKLFHELNEAALESLFSVLWYNSLPCFDIEKISFTTGYQSAMVKYCEWKGMTVSCAKVFDTFPTDIGQCCSFNMRKAEDIFLGETYVRLVQAHQEWDRFTSLKQNETFFGLKSDKPETASGRNKGLVVMLDAYSNRIYQSTISTDYYMFTGMLTPYGEYPFSAYSGFNIMPGAINEIGLTATQITADDSLRSLTPVQRNCRFPDENQGLVIYRNYSQSNCLFECFLLKSYEHLGRNCTPWYYPTTDNNAISMCDPWQTMEFNQYMLTNKTDQCSQCIPSCSSSRFRKKVVTVPFRNCAVSNFGVSSLCNLINIGTIPKPQIFSSLATQTSNNKLIPENLRNILEDRQRALLDNFNKESLSEKMSKGSSNTLFNSYDAYAKDMAMVRIYFETTTVLQIGTQSSSTWIMYFANVGGLLGLVLGMGIISFVELVWLAMRLLAHSTRAARLLP